MPGPDHSPASPDGLVQALAQAFRFDERAKPHRLAMDDMAPIATQTLASRFAAHSLST